MGLKLRVVGGGLYGVTFLPVYQFAHLRGRDEEGGVKCKSHQETSKNGVRLLITGTKMYENREMSNTDTKLMFPGTEGSFLKVCVSID